MKVLPYLRDAAVFAPCYVALDWASYVDPAGPFNITPWNPQPALAIVWMMLGGLRHAPAVMATIALAEVLVRHAPGGLWITLLSSGVLAAGYTALAWALRRSLEDAGLHSTREVTVFTSMVVSGTGAVGAAFVATLRAAGALAAAEFPAAVARFWLGDAVGVLVTAPLLLAAADARRRAAFAAMLRSPEALLQIAALGATLWAVFDGMGGGLSLQFYLLFLPMIWIAVRNGLTGAVAAAATVQIGVAMYVHGDAGGAVPVIEIQVRLAALTLTGLYLGVMVDQWRSADEGLRRTMRLAAAGEMAGAIAHEVNQPLTALLNYGRSARMLLEREPPDARLADDVVARMVAEADRAGKVVRRLRDFFRAGTTRLEPVRVADLAGAARRIGAEAIDGRRIEFAVDADPSLPDLYVDRLQIEVVLRNLIANAVDSILASAESGRISLSVSRQGDRSLVLVLADSGPGIPAERRHSLFEPLSSGKATGMGIGLAVSRAIAEAHGGSLEAATCGHGEFHLTLRCVPTP